MGHTNETNYLKLPQFVYGDEGTWLGDLNGAFQAIDTNAAAEHSAVVSAAEAASNAMQTANAASASAAETAGKIVEAEGDIDGLTGTVNTITSLIGNGEPTTTDKTVIGAINELHEDIENLPSTAPTAAQVSFVPPTGMSATNVQAAIEEVAQSGASDFNELTPTELALSATGSVNETFTELIGVKEVYVEGGFVGQQHIYNFTGSNIEKGWNYTSNVNEYTAAGTMSVNFETGAVYLRCGTFPSASGATVAITKIYYR